MPLGGWRRWPEFKSSALGRIERRTSRIVPLWISAALSHYAVDRLYGDLLGLRLTDVRNAGKPVGSLRSFDNARRPPAAGACAAAIPGFEPEAGWRGSFHHGTGRGYRITQFTASVSRPHRTDRRCFRIGGCDHRRGLVALVSSGHCAG